MTAAKWAVPPGSCAPDDMMLGRLAGTTGNRYHLGPADPYARLLCGGGHLETVDTAGPGGTLCRDCARLAGLTCAADLPVDESAAAFWRAQEALAPDLGDLDRNGDSCPSCASCAVATGLDVKDPRHMPEACIMRYLSTCSACGTRWHWGRMTDD